MYFAAVSESSLMAAEEGPYPFFGGSPASQGILHPDMVLSLDRPDKYTGLPCSLPTEIHCPPHRSSFCWDQLRADVREHGLRNSLFIAPMPTASTSHINGNSEGNDPRYTNLHNEGVLAGDFICINRYLVEELQGLGLWGPAMRDELIRHDGSVQNIEGIPTATKEVFRTAFEIPQRAIYQQAIDRLPFVDQSMSLNCWMPPDASDTKISSAYFFGWRHGLKTIVYYFRTKAAAAPVKFALPAAAPATVCKPGCEGWLADATVCKPGCEGCSA